MPSSPSGPPLSPTALLPHGSCCSQNPHPECGLCPGRRQSSRESRARDGAGRSPLIPPQHQPRLQRASAFTPAGQTPHRSSGRMWGQDEDGNRAWPHGRGTSRQEGPALNARASTARPGRSLTPGISGCGSWGSQRRRGPDRGRPPPSGARFSVALLTCVAPREWGPPTPPSPLRRHRERGRGTHLRGGVSRAAPSQRHRGDGTRADGLGETEGPPPALLPPQPDLATVDRWRDTPTIYHFSRPEMGSSVARFNFDI